MQPFQDKGSSTLNRVIPVIEVYGPVLQGEGALIGRATVFVRLGGCDYRCAWCDSMYAVDPKIVHDTAMRLTPEEILVKVRAVSGEVNHVTLSGGNPVIHDCNNLVYLLKKNGFEVGVETQGTIWRPWINHTNLVTVSPKPPSSKMNTDMRRLASFLYATTAPKVLKIVVFDDDDFSFAIQVHAQYRSPTMYLQPGNAVGEDTTEALIDKLRWLTARALKAPGMQDCIVLPQLHVLLFGNQRGK